VNGSKKVKFDATLDDLVDINRRVLKRSKLVKRWHIEGIVIVFLITCVVFYAISRGEGPHVIAYSAVWGAISSALYVLI